MLRDMTDEDFMRRAIGLAATQAGRTAENPSVGCVIVRDGAIVGEGVTGEGADPMRRSWRCRPPAARPGAPRPM